MHNFQWIVFLTQPCPPFNTFLFIHPFTIFFVFLPFFLFRIIVFCGLTSLFFVCNDSIPSSSHFRHLSTKTLERHNMMFQGQLGDIVRKLMPLDKSWRDNGVAKHCRKKKERKKERKKEMVQNRRTHFNGFVLCIDGVRQNGVPCEKNGVAQTLRKYITLKQLQKLIAFRLQFRFLFFCVCVCVLCIRFNIV